MKLNQVAAQLYTCRDLLKTPAEIAKTLRRVREAGYTAVQISGMGPIAEEELNAILDGEGLTCCATHENGAVILNETQKVIERLQKLRCSYTLSLPGRNRLRERGERQHPHRPTRCCGSGSGSGGNDALLPQPPA